MKYFVSQLSLVFLLLGTPTLFSQTTLDSTENWVSKFIAEYQGVYKFGWGETEADFKIIIDKDVIVAQILSGYWEDGTDQWKWRQDVLENVKIENNGRFSSTQFQGQFIRKKKGDQMEYGLRLDNPKSKWLGEGEVSIGIKFLLSIKVFVPGKYPEASFRLLLASEVTALTKEELKLMRNEIFARYGLLFRKEGPMDLHFQGQKWYFPQHKDVTQFLTEIELRNINLIKRAETFK